MFKNFFHLWGDDQIWRAYFSNGLTNIFQVSDNNNIYLDPPRVSNFSPPGLFFGG